MGSVTREHPEASRARAWLLVAPAVIVLCWGGNQFLPLLQLYRQQSGYSQVQVDILLAVYVIGIVPGFALSGAWSDRYGRKPVLLVGVALGIVGSIILASSASSLAGLCAGRFVCGLSVAAGMVVGTSWIKELSVRGGRAEAGARRASAVLTIGFGGGAGVGGALAQFAPLPSVLPYVVQIAASLAALVALLRAVETRKAGVRMPGVRQPSLVGDLRIPKRARARFVGVVLPLAPWVFAAPALAFAVGPSLVGGAVPGFAVGFATLVTVITLSFGWLTQFVSGPILRALRGRAGLVGVLFIAAGALLLIPASLSQQVWAVLLAAPVFGIGYGLSMVSGLTAVQAMATPDDLAGLTAVYYSLTYAGFLLPAILAALTAVTPMGALLVAVAGAMAVCALIAARGIRRHGVAAA
ncbi:putative MFS family arabinose efflux permease [Subtercola boreus]|nr:putative MFS family arabinose efflux permease [Subtercola boreus]